ncbi:MAG TPA: branched-chain amino acid ABC transporter permease [Candidatus Methylomirabilis sp.]|nr:branched-chain amino acid ABC transporter permease [Candidatus Methylomirabilis sp.]
MELFLQQVVNGLMIGSTYAVVALGFSLVFSVMRVVNMAHPEFFMVGAFGAYLTITYVTRNILGVLVGGMAAALVVGLAVERLAIRPVRGRYVMIPFIATSGVSIALQHTAERIFGSDPVLVPPVMASVSYNVGSLSVTRMQLVTFGIAAALMLALRYYVRSTKWGRATRAVAERPDVAAAFGVDVNLVSRLTIGISALMAGAAGVTIGLLYTSAWAFMGLLFGLKSFVCMLVAGNRHIEGVMVIGLLLGVLEALVSGYVTSTLRDAVAFGVLVVVLVFKPKGLFGSYDV